MPLVPALRPAHQGRDDAAVRRAEDAGFEVLVVTVDAPISGVRTREHRAGFHLPPGISAVNLEGLPSDAPTLNQGSSAIFDHFMLWRRPGTTSLGSSR
ncbi:MAG: alpha-hydroxy-acid oxidizing protein [Hyphomicrobium sp.]